MDTTGLFAVSPATGRTLNAVFVIHAADVFPLADTRAGTITTLAAGASFFYGLHASLCKHRSGHQSTAQGSSYSGALTRARYVVATWGAVFISSHCLCCCIYRDRWRQLLETHVRPNSGGRLYVPFSMAFWHAAPLAMWQGMGLFKAIFYSFFAVRRCGKAFLAYALGWIIIGIALPAVISAILSLLLGKTAVTVMLLMPLSVILTIVMYCSFYPTYTQVFDRPEQTQV